MKRYEIDAIRKTRKRGMMCICKGTEENKKENENEREKPLKKDNTGISRMPIVRNDKRNAKRSNLKKQNNVCKKETLSRNTICVSDIISVKNKAATEPKRNKTVFKMI